MTIKEAWDAARIHWEQYKKPSYMFIDRKGYIQWTANRETAHKKSSTGIVLRMDKDNPKGIKD